MTLRLKAHLVFKFFLIVEKDNIAFNLEPGFSELAPLYDGRDWPDVAFHVIRYSLKTLVS